MQARPDAAGMRYAASQIRVKADAVGAVIGRVDAQVGAMVFAGPAADQFRAGIAHERWRLTEVTRIMAEASALLTRAAAQVEADAVGFYQAGGAS
jgi:hypothetical protein